MNVYIIFEDDLGMTCMLVDDLEKIGPQNLKYIKSSTVKTFVATSAKSNVIWKKIQQSYVENR